jgi:hypothetical protein
MRRFEISISVYPVTDTKDTENLKFNAIFIARINVKYQSYNDKAISKSKYQM